MKNEADFKKVFKTSIKKANGFSLSLAAPMLPGLPDLYCILPGYIPLLLEAKWLGEVTSKFNRKINYSALQEHYLKEVNKVNPYTAFGLIGFKQDKKIYAVLTPFHMTQIDYLCLNHCSFCEYNSKTKTFDIMNMLINSKVPVIDFYQKHSLTTVAYNGNVPETLTAMRIQPFDR